MKKLITGLLIVGLVGSMGYLATSALFSDTEESVKNSFTTGTIDIAVDETNPWLREEPYELNDMKPGYTDYLSFKIENVGSNPANVWKKLTFTEYDNNPVSEPECKAEQGTWTPESSAPYGSCDRNVAVTDLESVIDYDLSVVVKDASGAEVWNQMIFNHEMTLKEIYGAMTTDDRGVFLGMVPAGWTMVVTQSYHMDEDAGNQYQGDSMTFDMALYAEQLAGTVYLDNKLQNSPEAESWWIQHDDTYGEMHYDVKAATLSYEFKATGLANNTKYYLIAYSEPFGNTQQTLGSATSNGSGGLAFTGEVDLGDDLINQKIWLVPDANYDESTSTMVGWNPNTYLFETGLMDYYDSL